MNANERRAMLERDRAEWERLTAALNAHRGGPVHDPESPEWEARHVYAHLARWMNHSMDDFEAVLAGRAPAPPPEGSDDEINARWRAEDEDVTFAEARAAANGAYERRMRLIESTPEERWSQPLALIANADGHQHYRGHRLGIESAS